MISSMITQCGNICRNFSVIQILRQIGQIKVGEFVVTNSAILAHFEALNLYIS